MPQKSNYSRLAQLRQSDRFRRAQQDPTLLQGLTPTQIAELFPDYFKRGTPDVGGFREAISRESARKQGLWQQGVNDRIGQQGGMLERMRREYGGGDGKISNPVKAQEIYNYLRSKGVDHAHAVGMLNNMEHESKLNSGAFNPNDVNGPSGGLFQHHSKFSEGDGGRFNNMVKFVGPDWKTNWKKQIDFALQEGETKKYLATPFNSAAEASVGFTQIFERPRDPNAGEVRLSTIKTFDRLSPTDTATADAAGKGGTPKQGDQKTGQTTGQQQGQTTPGSGGGGGTGQQAPINYNVVDGYIVPKDNSLYDPRNAQQCATLSKAMNPAIGRSSGWTVVDGEIKPGVVVATKQYNNSGADKVHSGYHTGVALSAPNEKGDFLLLEQYNGSGGAKTRWVNKDSYPIGDSGKTTSFGLISSGGKVHDEVSQEALAYGQKLGAGSAGQGGTPGTGGDTAPGVEGGVEYSGGMGGSSIGEGEQQSASLMQPVAMMQNLMGMMGGMIPQTAVPLGLITSALGFIMPLIGSLAGERLSGEGMGDGPRRGHRGHRLSQHRMHGVAGRIELNRESKADLAAKQSSPVSGPVELGDPSRAQKFLSLIAKGEGGYNSMNQGTVKGRIVGSTNDSSKVVGRKLTDMSIGEIMDMQKGSIKSGRKLFAVGKYQIIPDTMKIVAKTAGLKPEDKFDEANQEKLGMALIQKRPDLHAYLTGKSNNETAALRAAAEEWASLPDPHTGRSVYGHGNKSSHSVESVRAALRETRTEMLSAGQTQMANATPPTPEVRAAAATGQVGPTPTGMPGPTTQIVRTEPTFIERVRTLGGLGTAGRASAGTTPSPSIPVSTNISATKAPAIPFSREARNQEGIYGSFKRSDIEHQFGKGKQISLPSYMQQNNQEIIRQPSATVEPVKSTPGASPASTPMPVTRGVPAAPAAPGPAPDTVSTQMRNMNETMAAIQTRDAAAAKGPTREPERPIPQATHTEENMRNISQPFDNPSFHRAMSRAHGSETKGEVGQNHFTGPGDTSYAE